MLRHCARLREWRAQDAPPSRGFQGPVRFVPRRRNEIRATQFPSSLDDEQTDLVMTCVATADGPNGIFQVLHVRNWITETAIGILECLAGLAKRLELLR